MKTYIYFACPHCARKYKKEEGSPDGRFLIDIECIFCGVPFLLNYIGDEELEA